MQVCLLSQTDCAGQNYLLAEAMRKYLGWDAKSFSMANTYLEYPTDGILTQETVSEIRDFAECSDLFIFQDILSKVPGFRIDRMANKNNTIIYGLGSLMRNNLNAVMDYVKVGWHVLPPLSDPTITRYIGGAPFEAIIVDPLVWEQPITRRDDGIITICHAPTKSVKGEELFAKMVTEIEGVEWLVIKNKTWKEALELKSKAHIMLDSISDESYGLNCLEGLVLGQSVISSIAPWCYLVNKSLSIRSIWKSDNNEVVEILKDNVKLWRKHQGKEELNDYLMSERENIYNTYSQEIQADNWEAYVDWVMRG